MYVLDFPSSRLTRIIVDIQRFTKRPYSQSRWIARRSIPPAQQPAKHYPRLLFLQIINYKTCSPSSPNVTAVQHTYLRLSSLSPTADLTLPTAGVESNTSTPNPSTTPLNRQPQHNCLPSQPNQSLSRIHLALLKARRDEVSPIPRGHLLLRPSCHLTSKRERRKKRERKQERAYIQPSLTLPAAPTCIALLRCHGPLTVGLLSFTSRHHLLLL
jgi:hypothetical protein